MLKTNHQEELGRRGQRNSKKKRDSREKVALEKEQQNHEKELGKKKKKDKDKAIKGRICRERNNNAMLKRTEKRKQRRESSNISEITWPEIVTSGIFVKQVVFQTVNHCGLLPLRELHSTGETIVWRDPGGS